MSAVSQDRDAQLWCRRAAAVVVLSPVSQAQAQELAQLLWPAEALLTQAWELWQRRACPRTSCASVLKWS